MELPRDLVASEPRWLVRPRVTTPSLAQGLPSSGKGGARRFEHGEMTQQELASRVGFTRQPIIVLKKERYVAQLDVPDRPRVPPDDRGGVRGLEVQLGTCPPTSEGEPNQADWA